METTHLWTLIQAWLDGQMFPVSQAALAQRIGVSRSAMSQWKSGQSRPRPERLRALASVTRVPYASLLEAVVQDMGYLDAEERDGDGYAAPNTDAGGTPAGEDLGVVAKAIEPKQPHTRGGTGHGQTLGHRSGPHR